MSNKLDSRTKRLLASNILHRSGYTIIKIFLNIYLFKLTNDIHLVAIFNIIFLIFHISTYHLMAHIVKNKLKCFFQSLALIGYSALCLLVMFLGTSLPEYYVIVAALTGISSGMYRINYNTTVFGFTKKENRGNYHGLRSTWVTIVMIAIPSIAGTIIGLNYKGLGYEIVFGLGVIFFVLSLIFGLHKQEYNSDSKFNLKKASKKIFDNKNLAKLNFNSLILQFAISVNLVDVLLPIIIFSYGIGEMDLGLLVSFFSILSIIMTYLFGKYVKYSKYKLVYNILTGIYIASILLLIIYPELWYITIFSSIANIIFRMIFIPQETFTHNTLNDIEGHKEIVIEQMVISEWFMTIGKILVYICIYFVFSFDMIGIKLLFIMFAIASLASAFLFNSIKIPHKN